jgi:hypothetical protein
MLGRLIPARVAAKADWARAMGAEGTHGAQGRPRATFFALEEQFKEILKNCDG